MPSFVHALSGTTAATVMSKSPEVDIIDGLSRRPPFGGYLYAPLEIPGITAGSGALELAPGYMLQFGWTDEQSRAYLEARLANGWDEQYERITQRAGSPSAYFLAGTWIVGWRGAKQPIWVVSCANLPDIPAPWHRKVRYEDETETSLLIADLVGKTGAPGRDSQ